MKGNRIQYVLVITFLTIIGRTMFGQCPEDVMTIHRNADSVLQVMVDGRVFLQSGGGRWADQIGFAFGVPSPNFELPAQLKREVVMLVSHVPCTAKNDLWAVLTVRLKSQHEKGGPPTRFTLYILRAVRGSITILLSEVFPEVDSVITDDVNGDGLPEVVVKFTTGALIDPDSLIRIWQIEPNFQIKELSLKHVRDGLKETALSSHISVRLGDYKHHNWTIYSEQSVQEAEGKTLTVRRYYRWEPSVQDYILKDISKMEERQVP